MGILSNTVSIVQYQVTGKLPEKDTDEWLEQCLTGARFKSIEDTADEESIGWVNLDDHLASDFSNHFTFKRDHFLATTLRSDKRKVSSFLRKNYLSREYERFLDEHPKLRSVPRSEKEQIKDRIEFNLLTKTLPATNVVDLVWNTDAGIVTVTTTSLKTMELIEEYFRETFGGLGLTVVHPMARAEMVMDDSYEDRLKKINQASIPDTLAQIQDNLWAGREFLLWLMFGTRKTDSVYKITQPGPFDNEEPYVAYLDDRIVLVGESEDENEDGVRKSAITGSQSDFAEARKAIQKGKTITEGTIYFEKNDLTWKLTLKGDIFSFGSFKCPSVKIEKDELTDRAAEREAVFFERMHLLESGLQMFNSLYARFLFERMGKDWPEKFAQINDWVREK